MTVVVLVDVRSDVKTYKSTMANVGLVLFVCLRTSTVGVGQDPSSGVVVELVSQVEQAAQRSCGSTKPHSVNPG